MVHKVKRGILWKAVPVAAAVLVSALFLLALPSRAEAEVIASGVCGDAAVNDGNDITWSLDGNGTITISGSGKMNDYAQAEDVPWHEKRRSIKKAVISDGVTSVGSYAFKDCPNLYMSLELKVESIGDEAFRNCTAADIYYPSGCTLGTDTFLNAVSAMECTVTNGHTVLRLTASNGVGITIPETIGGGTVMSLQNDLRPELSIRHAGAHRYVDEACAICGKPLGDVVEISPENFPDEVFRSYVSAQFDTDGDGYLNQDEISVVTFINVDGKGVSSLQGIEFFTALKELAFERNSVETLDISKNTELELIFGDDNRLVTLDVSNNTKLVKLLLQRNPIQSLDVSNCPRLEVLWMSNAPIKELDVSQNPRLNYLGVKDGGLEAIDLSRNQEMKWLELDGNELSELDVTRIDGLLSLSCEDNSLTELDVSRNYMLESLYCSKNQIAELNLQSQYSLTKLWCSENKLTSLDLTSCRELRELKCWWNELTTLKVDGLYYLSELDCEHNCLTGLDLSDLSGLEELNVVSNEFETIDLTGNYELKILHCQKNKLEELDLSTNRELTEVQCWTNNIKSLNVSGLESLETLKCQNNKLTLLSLSDNAALTILWAWSNMLTSIDVSQNPLLNVDDYQIFNLNYNTYTINSSGTFDLSELPGNFNPAMTTDWDGATLADGMLTDFTADTVNYWYWCGRKWCYFTLKVVHEHALVKHDAVAAGCLTDGTGEYWKCEGEGGCNKLFSDEEGTTELEEVPVIAATGHSFGKWGITTEPTLTTKGEAERICTKNEEHKETKEVPVLTDTSVWTKDNTKHVEPSEEADGKDVYHSEDYGDVTVVLPATGHTHVWGKWKIAINPTLTTKGTAERICTKNNEHKETKELPVLTDTSVWTKDDTQHVEPSEEADGKDVYHSEDYGDVTVVLPATGHTHVWGVWVITTPPTLTRTGTAERVCTKNNEHKETKEVPVLTDTSVWTKDGTQHVEPSEGMDGRDVYHSEEYGDVTVVLPATGHTHVWGVWVITTPPTLTGTGTAERVCAENTAHRETKTLPALSDTSVWTKDDAQHVEPAEGMDGRDVYYNGEYGNVTVILPRPGHVHVLTYVPEKAATEEEEGVKAHWHCAGCGKDFSDENGTNEVTAEALRIGRIEKEVRHGENAPVTELTTPKEELIRVLLTAEEQEAVKDGRDIRIRLTVDDATDSVSEGDRTAVEAKIGDLSEYELGQYLDVNLLKIIGNAEEKITRTSAPVTITFAIPESLLGKKAYSVIRLHDGEVTVLPDLDDDENTVTIETDRFSTYALIYREETGNVRPVEPATGEGRSAADVAVVIFPAILSAAAVLLLLERRKRKIR